MIAPYRHLKSISDLEPREFMEMFEQLKGILDRLKRLMKPHGYNIGMNMGRDSGAGYDRHVHLHIVPRWRGDTNFMPVVNQDKVISESLATLRERFVALDSRRKGR